MAEKVIRHNLKKSYVYEVLVDGVVRYIGKGTGNRDGDHLKIAQNVVRRRDAGETVKTQKFYNRLAKAIRSNSTISHRIVVEGLSTDEAFAEEIAAIAGCPEGQLWNTLPGGQGADSEHFKRNWSDPLIREKMLSRFKDQEVLDAIKKRVAEQWSDQSARERNRKKVSEQWRDPEFRASRIAAMSRAASTEERKDQVSRRMKEKWADPEFRKSQAAKIKEAASTSDRRAKSSQKSKAMWNQPGFRENVGRKISDAHLASGKMKTIWLDPDYRERRRKTAIEGWKKRKARALALSSSCGGKNTEPSMSID